MGGGHKFTAREDGGGEGETSSRIRRKLVGGGGEGWRCEGEVQALAKPVCALMR